jgi:hypothetical protein
MQKFATLQNRFAEFIFAILQIVSMPQFLLLSRYLANSHIPGLMLPACPQQTERIAINERARDVVSRKYGQGVVRRAVHP